jgi:hypothetical protein
MRLCDLDIASGQEPVHRGAFRSWCEGRRPHSRGGLGLRCHARGQQPPRESPDDSPERSHPMPLSHHGDGPHRNDAASASPPPVTTWAPGPPSSATAGCPAASHLHPIEAEEVLCAAPAPGHHPTRAADQDAPRLCPHVGAQGIAPPRLPLGPCDNRLGRPPACHDLGLGELIDRLLEFLRLQDHAGDDQQPQTQSRARLRQSSHHPCSPLRSHAVEATAAEASGQPATPATPRLTEPVRPAPRPPARAGRWPAPCHPGRTPSVCCARRSRGNRPRSLPPRGPRPPVGSPCG